MAEFQFECPECGSWIEADEVLGGMPVECPGCGASITVPRTGLVPGTELGDFVLERRIGIGGMGEVWLAVQKSLERRIALKILPGGFAKDPDSVSMFMKEIQIAGKLSHPNIVEAYYAGLEKGLYFMASEYVEGIELSELIASHEPLSEHEALRIADKIARALSYAWDKFQLLHRDVKPSNIMLAFDGEPKLMDMGISSIQGDEEQRAQAGVVVGTPQYMSPEQGFGDPSIDFRADIYSLGATLHHLATGYVPFDGASHADIISSHARLPLKPPHERNPRLSLECSALIMAMMAKRKEERQGSWSAVIKDIELVQRGLPPATALPSGPVDAQARASSGRQGKSSPPIVLFPSPDPLCSADFPPPDRDRRGSGRKWLAGAAAFAIALCAVELYIQWPFEEEPAEEEQSLIQDAPAAPRETEKEEPAKPAEKAAEPKDEAKPPSAEPLPKEPQEEPKKEEAPGKTPPEEPGNSPPKKIETPEPKPVEAPKARPKSKLEIYSEEAKLGDAAAMRKLGALYQSGGPGFPPDKAKAVEWYVKAVEKGDAEAMIALGRMHAKGDGVPKSAQEALALYEKAASSNDNAILKRLASMFERGDGVRKNIYKAIELYTKAADTGDVKAMMALGVLYTQGKTDMPTHEADELKTIEWYSKAADLKDTEAMVALGLVYANADEPVRSGKKAVELFTEAMNLGNSYGTVNLGIMYSRGQGVPTDLHYAFFLYEKAAKTGNPQAMFNIGVCYMTGQGVGQDIATARSWLKKAAKAGSEDAKDYMAKRRFK